MAPIGRRPAQTSFIAHTSPVQRSTMKSNPIQSNTLGDDEHAGHVAIHIEAEGEYGFALPHDVEFYVLMGEGGHDDHDEHKDGHEGHEGHAHGEFDPHIWLDPLYAIKQSKAVLDALSAKDPSNMDYYLGNYQKLEQDLQSLHQDYTNGLSSCKHEEFVISHAAFGYIAARYNLDQIEIAGLSAEASPSAARLAEIAERVGKLGLGSVLVEALQWDNSVSQTLANESNLQALPVHVIGTVTRDELNEHADYMGLMRNNLKSLQTAMECSA